MNSHTGKGVKDPAMMFIQVVFLAFSMIVTLFFFLYGFNNYYLLSASRRYRTPMLPPGSLNRKPCVAIHLPIYNEKYVVHRLVAACARMADEYGIESVRICVIDDSDDETAGIVDQVVEGYQEKHYRIEVLRRGSRQGFKAGALQAALDRTEEEYIAIFDADFIPPPNFLHRTVPFLVQDDRLGIIQSRWTHINRDYNVLTSAIALGIDVHFLVEQAGRYAAGCFQNFNGSGGILRKKALLQAGGWHSDTLAEDLDVSYRIQFQGYRVLYLRDLLSPGEVPPTVPSYKKQQGRWACGSLRTARKLFPILMSERELGFNKRLQAFIHMTGYMVHPLIFSSFLLACTATLLGVDRLNIADIFYRAQAGADQGTLNAIASIVPQHLIGGLMGVLLLLCSMATWLPPVVALRSQAMPGSRKLSSFIIFFLLGCGISLSNTIEIGKGLLTKRNWAFKRTPKYAIECNEGEWQGKRYQVAMDYVCLLELAFVTLGSSAIGYAIWRSNLGALLVLVPFTIAYAFVTILTILQSRNEPGN
jgi:cellulose synthase/poly-beta-1,6-N-acetylglucosamine synthase-like glycosyltransferase